MSEISFDMEGIDEAVVKFEELNLFTRKEVIRLTAKSTLDVHKVAREKVPTDTANLKNNIFTRFEDGGLTGIIFTTPAYAPYVEYGRPPGKQPPLKALEGWAKRHGLQGLEFVIARAIGERGVKPQPFLRPAFEEFKGDYMAQVRQIVRDMEGV